MDVGKRGRSAWSVSAPQTDVSHCADGGQMTAGQAESVTIAEDALTGSVVVCVSTRIVLPDMRSALSSYEVVCFAQKIDT